MTKRITVELTQNQVFWIEFLLRERITELTINKTEYKNYDKQIAYGKRILTSLAKAKNS